MGDNLDEAGRSNFSILLGLTTVGLDWEVSRLFIFPLNVVALYLSYTASLKSYPVSDFFKDSVLFPYLGASFKDYIFPLIGAAIFSGFIIGAYALFAIFLIFGYAAILTTTSWILLKIQFGVNFANHLTYVVNNILVDVFTLIVCGMMLLFGSVAGNLVSLHRYISKQDEEIARIRSRLGGA